MSKLFVLPVHFALLPEGSPAFGGEPERKAAALEIARNHREADMLLAGTYGKGEGENFRGCDMGCMVRGHAEGADIHEEFAEQYGGNTTLAYVYDHIFEALPEAERKYWPEQHLEATPIGADLSGVMDRFRAWMLRDLLDIPDLAPDVYAAGEGMAALFERRIAGDEPTEAEWEKAARDAWDAWIARDACDAWVAVAARDAWDAWIARDACDAWGAWDARDARDAWGTRARDALLKALSEAPQAVST